MSPPFTIKIPAHGPSGYSGFTGVRTIDNQIHVHGPLAIHELRFTFTGVPAIHDQNSRSRAFGPFTFTGPHSCPRHSRSRFPLTGLRAIQDSRVFAQLTIKFTFTGLWLFTNYDSRSQAFPPFTIKIHVHGPSGHSRSRALIHVPAIHDQDSRSRAFGLFRIHGCSHN
ncbi:hypothetical protein C8F04DRAFT_1187933 [Mycena alexandri]|uniref:Uncharacterized protein n=1 Tax=Mycena alexandri TaxID=1745969 RepID=A0AAD6WVQ3_9AGAR|nr:hypothetical protein C8F04DRAFT_1187933 [Mycena alexandri]